MDVFQVILRPRSEDEEEEEVEEKPKKKKTKKVKRKKRTAGGKPEPTPAEVLTKTLAQALRLINEQKVRVKNVSPNRLIIDVELGDVDPPLVRVVGVRPRIPLLIYTQYFPIGTHIHT